MNFYESTCVSLLREKASTKVQTLILAKDRFKSAADAKAWAKSHGYKSGKVDETGESFRVRQFDPDDFEGRPFRTINFGKGVKAVVVVL